MRWLFPPGSSGSSGWIGACALLLCLGACGDDTRRPPTDSAVPRDTNEGDTQTGADADTDAGQCDDDGDCDDGHDCTLDRCGVGGVCAHDALSERCEAGETCSPTAGCISSCDDDAQCQNGSFCDGRERCVAGSCFAATRPVDCDDGNMCTVDSCDDTAGGCAYEPAAGCDAGVPVTDAGTRPFDPSRDYDGTFLVAPAPSLGCPPASYAVDRLMFRVDGDTLVVMADRFRLTQSPVPTGASFNVSSTADGSCSTVSLSGMFESANLLSAAWSATCGVTCGTQNRDLVGERTDG